MTGFHWGQALHLPFHSVANIGLTTPALCQFVLSGQPVPTTCPTHEIVPSHLSNGSTVLAVGDVVKICYHSSSHIIPLERLVVFPWIENPPRRDEEGTQVQLLPQFSLSGAHGSDLKIPAVSVKSNKC